MGGRGDRSEVVIYQGEDAISLWQRNYSPRWTKGGEDAGQSQEVETMSKRILEMS